MTTYKIYDIIIANAPFSDIAKSKPRPLVIVSTDKFNNDNRHVIACMVTTARITKWHNDIKIKDTEQTGLNSDSNIRAKFFTLDNRLIKKKIGTLSKADAKNLKKHFNKIIFA